MVRRKIPLVLGLPTFPASDLFHFHHPRRALTQRIVNGSDIIQISGRLSACEVLEAQIPIDEIRQSPSFSHFSFCASAHVFHHELTPSQAGRRWPRRATQSSSAPSPSIALARGPSRSTALSRSTCRCVSENTPALPLVHLTTSSRVSRALCSRSAPSGMSSSRLAALSPAARTASRMPSVQASSLPRRWLGECAEALLMFLLTYQVCWRWWCLLSPRNCGDDCRSRSEID